MSGVAYYQSCFNDFVGTDALRSLRQKAIEHFAAAGFPTTKDEEVGFYQHRPAGLGPTLSWPSRRRRLPLPMTTATALMGWSLSMATSPARIPNPTSRPTKCTSSV